MNIQHGGFGGVRKLPVVPRAAPPMPAVKPYRHPLDRFDWPTNKECQPEFRSFELSISLALWSMGLSGNSLLPLQLMSAIRDENNT